MRHGSDLQPVGSAGRGAGGGGRRGAVGPVQRGRRPPRRHLRPLRRHQAERHRRGHPLHDPLGAAAHHVRYQVIKIYIYKSYDL